MSGQPLGRHHVLSHVHTKNDHWGTVALRKPPLSMRVRRLLVVVVGFILTATIAAAPATAWASTTTGYRLVDLGSLGGWYARAEAVNDHNQVVGGGVLASGETHAFLWVDGQMTDLGTLGGSYSYAFDINSLGQVVGNSVTASGESHPFLWADGRMVDLGGQYCSAGAINDLGQVIGNCSGRPVMWWQGQMTDLTEQGLPPYTSVNDINDSEQIVGSYSTNGEYHAYRYAKGKLFDFGAPAGVYSNAFAVNGHGQAVGSGNGANGFINAYYWSGHHAVAIGSFDDQYSEAFGINNRGQVVGVSTVSGGALHGFVWQHGVMVDLGVAASGGMYEFSRATDVNADGLIVGEGVVGNEIHPLLWLPDQR